MTDLNRRTKHAVRDSRKALAQDLAAFNSSADLNDLAAILDRHDDAETAGIRELVDWTRAA